MEVAFTANQERLCPYEEKNEEDRSKFDDLWESPISVRNLDELIDENHVIILSSIRMKYYIDSPDRLGTRQTNHSNLSTPNLLFNCPSVFYNQRPTSAIMYLFIYFAESGVVKPCLWNGMKRLCYLFARNFI
ncbi:unnamed protein product [Musa acuminata var. zebrina]